MRKVIKISGTVLSAFVLLLIILPVVLALLLDIPAVQNFVVHKTVALVSERLGTTVRIDRVDIGLFSKLRVEGFYVEDYGRDTLLYASRVEAYVSDLGLFGGGLEFSRSSAGCRIPTGSARATSASRSARPRSRIWSCASTAARGANANTASTSRTCIWTA